jgi:SpoVK/Ycf46/Vps4 family AAA+-type ATPase
MTTARHIIGLLKSHIDGDEDRFFATAMQLAAHEARQGHGRVAEELRALIDQAKTRKSSIVQLRNPVPIAQPRGELAGLLNARYPTETLADMVLPADLEARLVRVLAEQRQQERLRSHGLRPRRKLLLVGPPGAGKTLTAAALAGELKLPLLTVVLDGLITKFMGETAGKLRLVFDAMASTRGVYFFDEFDAIGARRGDRHDVGEIRRVLNSFLQFLEQDDSAGLIVAATNHPDLLDSALFRRFDDVIAYQLPDAAMVVRLLQSRLCRFSGSETDFDTVAVAADGLSQAEVIRIADDAAKSALLDGLDQVTTDHLLRAVAERRAVQPAA